jgi:hypothetical protein
MSWLEDTAIKIRFQVRVRDFFLLHSNQIGSGAHPAVDTGDISTGIRWPGYEADSSN